MAHASVTMAHALNHKCYGPCLSYNDPCLNPNGLCLSHNDPTLSLGQNGPYLSLIGICHSHNVPCLRTQPL
ncbi:hypothetical protein RRG08_010962 [Elysia crispata]|uniref:Uncharacterized protein n=1 Tax=Elysia crispata TaxID=231223 RepID=A0AAE1CMS7_9GAST|nr:hypothetical protein RRG08_010962 [Elysia crispata]